MGRLDAVVFDMAGTTVQATDLVPAAFSDAFRFVQRPLSDAQIEAVRGKAKREAIAELLGDAAEELADRVYDRFQHRLISGYEEGDVDAINGAEETFRWLHGRGAKVALTTGFDRNIADLLVQRLGWTQSVDALICNEDVRRGRPAPYLIFRAMERMEVTSVERVVVVGDTVSDLQSAFNAGVCHAVGVLSGAHSEDMLRAQPHWAIIPSVRQLPELLDNFPTSPPT